MRILHQTKYNENLKFRGRFKKPVAKNLKFRDGFRKPVAKKFEI